MRLFDTHFHYNGEATPTEFMNSVRNCAQEAELKGAPHIDQLELAAMGCDYIETCRARDFARLIPECRGFAAGVHPHEADDYLKNREDFSEFAHDPKLLAIGELGLDYFYELSDHEHQKQVFEEFLNWALELHLPAIVHLRDAGSGEAYTDAYPMLKSFAASGGKFVVHCFAGTVEQAALFLELGAYLGVTGLATFKRAENVRDTLRTIPLEQLLIETDTPYLAPVPFRGRDNTPGFLGLIAANAAQVLNLDVETLAQRTTANAHKFYNLESVSC